MEATGSWESDLRTELERVVSNCDLLAMAARSTLSLSLLIQVAVALDAVLSTYYTVSSSSTSFSTNLGALRPCALKEGRCPQPVSLLFLYVSLMALRTEIISFATFSFKVW